MRSWLVFALLASCSPIPISPADSGSGEAAPSDALPAEGGGTPVWSQSLDGNVVRVLAIDPKAPSTVFAGATSGGATNGFYRSKDNGKTWAYVPNLPKEAAHSIAIHPQQNIILASLGIETYRSTDGGETWMPLSFGHVYTLAFHPTQSTAWTVTSQVGVYRSMDGGMTFNKLTTTGLPAPNTQLLGPLVYDGSKLYLAADDSAGMYVSGDDGVTWTPTTGLPSGTVDARVLAIAPQPGKVGVVFAQTLGSGMYRSDNGSAFVKVDLGMEKTRYAGLAFDPTTTTTLYVSRDDAEILRSLDTGKTWTKAGPTGVSVAAIAVSPMDGTVFTGTIGAGVWRFGR